jgi:hypothetical protein
VKGREDTVNLAAAVPEEQIFYRGMGNFMGGNASLRIDRLIYVSPAGYSRLKLKEMYEVARLIGRINRSAWCEGDRRIILLAGPGRWGTSTPNLGIPVSYAEISNIKILMEIEFESEGLSPELSYGTHFFQDLVENDIFYTAVFPGREGVSFRTDWMDGLPNAFGTLFPEQPAYGTLIRMVDLSDHPLVLSADVVSQEIRCFFEGKPNRSRKPPGG